MGKEPAGDGPSYFEESRSHVVSLVSILPLLLLYHFGIIVSGYGERNLAEVWLTKLLSLEAAHVLNAVLAVAFIAVIWKADRTGSFSVLVLLAMLGEGLIYAFALYRAGPVVAGLINSRASGVFFAIGLHRYSPVLLALGAGVYEELFFRVLVMAGGAMLLERVFEWDRFWSLGLMLVLSSVLFAAAHHIGALGDPWDSYTFLFRTVCGLVLGAIFIARGLGVAVWTHAIYNALVMLPMAAGAA